MAEQKRAHLNRSMEKSFEDLLTGLDDEFEPDIDDIFTNYDHLPEKVTDATFNAMAFQKPKSPTPTSSRQKEEVEEDEPSPGKVQMEEDLDIQLPRVAKNTDPGIQSESEDEEHEPSNGELEFVSSNREGEEEGEGEVYDASKLILPSVGESSTDDTLLGNVELEEDEEEEEEDLEEDEEKEEEEEEKAESEDDSEGEDMEDQTQTKEEGKLRDQKDLTMFSGLDQDDSDPDIDKLVAECDFLPETVTDSTINAMVDRNRPLAKSYRQSQEEESDEQDEEETMETDSGPESSPPPEVKIRVQKEASLDFSVLEPDSNHLDVDIGKQKTNLRKKGSLAKRRKPTRSTVRSALLSGEETLFVDSTEPKVEKTSRKDDEDDVFGQRTSTSSVEGAPTSPPAKKPSKVMVPLPGFGGPVPALRKRSEEQHEAEMAVDEPKKKDFRSYGVKLPVPQMSRKSELEDTPSKPVLRKVPRKDSAEKQETEVQYDVSSLKSVKKEARNSKADLESDVFFEKPALRQVARDDNKDRNSSSEMTFEKPALRNVSRPSLDKSNETDMKFEIPALKQVSRERGESDKSETDSDKTFSKPPLKSTPKPSEERSAPISPKTPEPKTFELPSLRPTPKASRSKPMDTQQDVGSFEKPSLRNVSRPLERKNSGEAGSFEKPALRNVGKPPLPEKRISIAEDDSEDKHKFDVPALRMVPRDQKPTETLRNISRGEKESDVEVNRRPSLKSTPRKDPIKAEEGKETPSWLKDMKLRKTRSQADDINNVGESREKPEWLHTATEKREKALESLNSKDDTRENYVPSWQKAKDNRHASNPNLNFVTPSSNSDEPPDWKKALAEKRKTRRDSDTPVKPAPGVDSQDKGLPPWKKELAKKGMKPSVPVKTSADSKKVEPEWKQKAAEKRERIITHFKPEPDDEEKKQDSSIKP
eukprot:XP_019921871.1 PREDICTED: neurofilament heavy polypeptide isoform X8 [Crassostrea gigas]